jgi:cyclophilin family peptidyl-prolyl cis-trans isomerase/HEAT repeat protein
MEDERDFDLSIVRAAAEARSGLVRRHAAVTAGRLKDPAALPVLEELLADADSSVAASAAFAIGQIGDTAGVAILSGLFGSGPTIVPTTVASEAAYGLGMLASAGSRLALNQILSRPPSETEPATVGSALLAIWRKPRQADPDPIVRWTDHADPEIRWRATYALVRRPDPDAVSLLLNLASDADERVRALAIRGLSGVMVDSAEVDRAVALEALLAALEDPAYTVRINAIRSLGGYDEPRSIQALQGLLESDADHYVVVAAESLGRLGSNAVAAADALESIASASDRAVSVRQSALGALTTIRPSSAVAIAGSQTGHPHWRMRAAAARTFASVADPAAAAMIGDADGKVSAAALQAIIAEAGAGSLGSVRGILMDALESPDVMTRATAISALGRLGDPRTLGSLLDAYDRARGEPMNDAALAAISAIAAMEAPAATAEFFDRFERPADYLLRLAAADRFGPVADSEWGPALPVSTSRDDAYYREIARRIIEEGNPSPTAVIETDAGQIRVQLFMVEAPLTVFNFIELAEQSYFDGQEWPRVVPNFVVQGGDPRGDMNGGPGYSIRDEINRHRYATGTLGMALSGPDTGGSQFFITHSPQPHLDGIYTVFGEVIDGQAVTELILPGDEIRSIRIFDS